MYRPRIRSWLRSPFDVAVALWLAIAASTSVADSARAQSVETPPAPPAAPTEPEPPPPAPPPAAAPPPPAQPSDAGVTEPSEPEAPPPPTPSPEAPELQPPAAATPRALSPAAAAATLEPVVAPDEPEQAAVDITVVGTKVAQTAGSAHVIREQQLQRFEYDDAHAALQQVPGVYVRQEDGIGLRPNIGIRGANPDRSKKITLMEDGVLFGPAPYSAPAAYYFPLLTRMTQVRVINGPSAVAYGPHTVGGAIDFVTRAIPTAPSAALDLAGGEYGYRKAHGFAGTSDGQFGMLIEGVHLHNSGFKLLPDDADTGSTRNEWMVKGSYLVDPSASATHELRLKLTYSEETSNETYLGLSDGDFRADPYRRYPASALDQMKNHRTSIVANHVFDARDEALKLTTTFYRHDYARIWRKVNRFRGAAIAGVLAAPDDPANAEYYAVLSGEADSLSAATTLWVGPNDRSFVSQGVQGVLELRDRKTGPLTHRLELGLRLHNDVITRRHSEDAFDMLDGELVPVMDEATSVTAANEGQVYALAAHVLDAIRWGDLTLTPGVRLELIASRLDDYLEGDASDGLVVAVMPGIGAFYQLPGGFGLLAGVYRGFSPPPPGSQDFVDPEYSLNYEAGARFSAGRTQLELIGFLNDYSNLTDVCTFSSGCLSDDLDRQFDAGEALIFGFEAYVAHELALGAGNSLPLSAAYTHSHAEFRNSFQSSDPIYGSVERGDELPYVPRDQLNVTAGFDSRYAGANVAFNYVAAMREEAGSAPFDESVVTDEQITVDVGADLRLLPNLRVYANLRNVTGARDIVARRPYGARPNAPRWFQVGIKGSL